MSGVPQQTISRVESGTYTPSLDLLLRLCIALGAEPSELFAWPTLRQVGQALETGKALNEILFGVGAPRAAEARAS